MRKKSEIVTFKVDGALLEELRKVPNRSAFIRSAVLSALEATCPLCQGSGILSAAQQKHWNRFAHDHAVTECDDCHELYLVCGHEASRKRAATESTRTKNAAGRSPKAKRSGREQSKSAAAAKRRNRHGDK